MYEYTQFLWKNLKERCYREDLRKDGRLILKLILEKQTERAWTGFNSLKIWSSAVAMKSSIFWDITTYF
jgi:hypothetical protein